MGRAVPRFAAVLAFLLVAAACGEIETLTTEQALDRVSISSTKVYAADGSLIANLHGEINRDIVALDDIPQHVQDAALAIEDQRFWAHGGLDLRAITRAVLANVGVAGDGDGLQGGSTISQQLVKNIYFPTPSRTIERKLAEAQLTVQFERTYAKDEILEMYLNTVYFGRGVYGVQTAAQSYFRKDVGELEVDEAAYLAGLIHEPGRYAWSDRDPPEAQELRRQTGTARRNLVLHRMADMGAITREEAQAASERPLEIAPPKETNWQHPYFVDMVLRELGVLRNGVLDERFAFLGETIEERGRTVYRGGLRIHTTLDPGAQSAAEQAVADILPAELDRLSVALASVEPGTGHVRAAIGGRDYYPSDCPTDAPAEELSHVCRLAKVNLALGEAGGGSGRQPGSAFKTFVLAAALEDGIGLRRTYNSSPFEHKHPSGVWRVTNYAGSGSGHIDLIQATVRSVNAAYARLEIDGLGEGDALAGAAKVADVARRMGIGFPTPEQVREACGERYGHDGACTPADAVPAIALGAKEVSPLELAAAYATIANGGVYARPTTITRITDAAGEVLYEAEPETRRAISEDVAAGISHVLQQVIRGGTGTRARIGRPAAGKTGTSQMWRDAWFAGYVPQLATVVWIGNPIPVQLSDGSWALESMTPRSGYPLRIVGGTYPSMIWSSYMRRALEGVSVERFPEPPRSVFQDSKRTTDRDREDDRDRILSESELADDERDPAAAEQQAPGRQQEARSGGVPNVVGMSQAAARSAIRRAGFNSAVVRECSPSGGDEGLRVWRQSPGGGTQARQGSTVTIWVNPAVCR